MKNLIISLTFLASFSGPAVAEAAFDPKEVVSKYCAYDVLQNYDHAPMSKREAGEACWRFVASKPKAFPFMAFAICSFDSTVAAKKEGTDTASAAFIKRQKETCEGHAGGAEAVNASMAYWKQEKSEAPWAEWPSRIERTKLEQAQSAGVKATLLPNSTREAWLAAEEGDKHLSTSRMVWQMQGQTEMSVEAFKALGKMTEIVVSCVDSNMSRTPDHLNKGRSVGNVVQTCFLIKSLEVSGKKEMSFKNLPNW